MAYQRAQVRELADVRPLQPQRRAVDTYAAPEQPPINNDKKNLAEALRAFGAAISSLGKGKEQPALLELYRIRQSAGDPEFLDMMTRGKLSFSDNPHFRAERDKMLAEAAVNRATDAVLTRMKDGTLHVFDENDKPIDVGVHLRDEIAKYRMVPNSVTFMRAYSRGLQSAKEKLVEYQRQRVAEVNKEFVANKAKDAIENIIGMAANGANDLQLRTAMLQATVDGSKYFALQGREMDAYWIDRIRAIQTSHPEVAKRLLTLDRGVGRDGQPIGALIQNGTHRDESRKIMDAANTALAKKEDDEIERSLVEQAAKALRAGGGSFHNIIDHRYENSRAKLVPGMDAQRHIPRSRIQDKAFDLQLQALQEEYKRQYADPATQPEAQANFFEREYELTMAANRPNTRWQGVLTQAGRILTNPASLSSPENQRKVMAAHQLYETLHRRNPGYLQDTLGLTEREHKLYQHVTIYQRLGEPTNIAIQKASDFVNNPKTPLSGAEVAELRKAAERLDYSIGPWRDFKNTARAQQMVFETAQAIAADRGISIKDAAKMAKELLEERAFAFNGQFIPPDPGLTRGTAKFFQTRLDEIFRDHRVALEAQGVRSGKGLSLLPLQQGRWTEVDGKRVFSGRYRVVDSDGRPVVVPRVDKKGNVIPGEFDYLTVHKEDIDKITAAEKKAADERNIIIQRNAADLAIVNAPKRTLPRGKYPFKIGQGYQGPDAMGNYIPGPTDEERSAALERIKKRSGEGKLPAEFDPFKDTVNIP